LFDVVELQSDVVFIGTRRGLIYCYRSGQLVNRLHHLSSVFSLNVMRDDHYVIAADCSGQVRLSLDAGATF
jgi:hypothetical protein